MYHHANKTFGAVTYSKIFICIKKQIAVYNEDRMQLVTFGNHRIPSVVEYFENKQIQYKTWFKDGNNNRIGGPAIIKYFKNGQTGEERWYKDGNRHRPGDAPAIIKYFKNGQIKYEIWFKNNIHHRIDDPAVIEYFENGQIKYEAWFINGELHRHKKFTITL